MLELRNFGEVDIVREAFELEAREGDLDGVNIADGRADFLFSGSRADISELKIPCKLILHRLEEAKVVHHSPCGRQHQLNYNINQHSCYPFRR